MEYNNNSQGANSLALGKPNRYTLFNSSLTESASVPIASYTILKFLLWDMKTVC